MQSIIHTLVYVRVLLQEKNTVTSECKKNFNTLSTLIKGRKLHDKSGKSCTKDY